MANYDNWFGAPGYPVPPEVGPGNQPQNWQSWGRIEPAAMENADLRALYFANELLPWLNPFSQAFIINEYLRPNRRAMEDAGLTTAAGAVDNYYGGAPTALSTNAFYDQLGQTADVVRSAANALMHRSAGYGTPEADWLHNVGRQLADVTPEGDFWTYEQVRNANDVLDTIFRNIPEGAGAFGNILQAMVLPKRREVQMFSTPGATARSSWFS